MDVTHVSCGADGWGHLTAVIDCHDRKVTGYEFALRGRAREAEWALEEACLARFGTVRPEGSTPVIRSDNVLRQESRDTSGQSSPVACGASGFANNCRQRRVASAAAYRQGFARQARRRG